MSEETDWVTARSKCTLHTLFEQLKTGVERDTETRHAIPGEASGFRFVANGRTFFVAMNCDDVRHTVKFQLGRKTIAVTLDDEPLLEGEAMFCDDGICRLSVDGVPLELWQFRRRALERLFFGF